MKKTTDELIDDIYLYLNETKLPEMLAEKFGGVEVKKFDYERFVNSMYNMFIKWAEDSIYELARCFEED